MLLPHHTPALLAWGQDTELLYMLLLQRCIITNTCSEAECLRFLKSFDSFNHFPLPFPVDRRAHGDVLERLRHPELLTRLIHDHSDVTSTLATTSQNLVRFIDRATQVYTHSPREYTNIDFSGDIQIVRQQIRLADS